MTTTFQSLVQYTLQTTSLEIPDFNNILAARLDEEIVLWSAENEGRPFPDDHWVGVDGPMFDYEIHYIIHLGMYDFVMGHIFEQYRAIMNPNNLWTVQPITE